MDWQELKAYFEGMKSILYQLDIKMLRDEYDEVGIKYYLYDVDVQKRAIIFINQDILNLPNLGPFARSLYIDSGAGINITKREDIINEIHQALIIGYDSEAWVCVPEYYSIMNKTEVKARIDQAIERLQVA